MTIRGMRRQIRHDPPDVAPAAILAADSTNKPWPKEAESAVTTNIRPLRLQLLRQHEGGGIGTASPAMWSTTMMTRQRSTPERPFHFSHQGLMSSQDISRADGGKIRRA